MSKTVFTSFIILCLISTVFLMGLALNIQIVRASGTIYIRANGNIDPPTANITSVDNVTYTFTNNIFNQSIVVERDNIVVDGAGYTLQGTEGGKGIDLTSRSNVTIKNVTIKAFSYGIYLDSSSNSIISGNTIIANSLYGIYLYLSSNNNSVSGNNVRNNYGGIDFYGSSSNTILGNIITNNSYRGIRLYGSYNNSIVGNVFANDGLVVEHSYGNVVEDNLVNGKPLVYLEGMSGVTIENAGQVILTNCDNICVENLNLSHTIIGLHLWNTTNTKITGNSIENNNDAGIYLVSSSNNNSISGNNITNNRYGILLSYFRSGNNNISENNLGNNGVGIYVFGSFNTLSGNNITNSSCGIEFSDSSNNMVYGNTIIASRYWGIWLTDSLNNSISGNTIASSEYGIYLSYSSNNSVYHNNFIGNTHQVGGTVETSSSNVWDDGIGKGNYWSDYEDRYPDAEELDGYGVWDTPYEIDENNQDNYPIVPEFPSLILPLFMVTTLLVIIIYKKKVSISKTPNLYH